ncbi:GspE/PulE family protein [Patescibacteria group bacterium]
MTKFQEKLTEIRTRQEQGIAKQLAEKLNIPFLDLKIFPIETKALSLVSKEKSIKAKLAVIQKKDKELFIAVCDPRNPETKSTLSELERNNYKIKIFISSLLGLKRAWTIYNKIQEPKKEEIAGKVKVSKIFFDKLKKEIKNLEDIKRQIEKIPTDQTSAIVEILLAGGIQINASDIHLEIAKEKIIIRYRIDGILQDITFLPVKSYSYILNKIKLLSGAKLNVHNKAQDGSFAIEFNKIEIQTRVSIIPSAYGENIVIRILNPKAINLELEDLGLRKDHLDTIKREIKKTKGMIITTGPTGSGKTTLLYSLIKAISKPEVKIITLEDPIEYHLKGITQTQIETEKGYSSASGLRAILRQDPDIVLIGEIRDKETAEIAIQAALTGHLVLSTLHTNDAAGAIPRFIDMDANPSSLSAGLNVIIAQRLVRRLCKECKKAISPSSKQISEMKKTLEKIKVDYPVIDKKLKIYQPNPKGCKECNNGYKNRIGIFEMILINEEMEKLINSSPGRIEILEKAQRQDMINFYQDGIIKVLQGITSLEEIERATGEYLE